MYLFSTGGNSTIGRCEVGYDDNEVLCMVCAKDYVMQDGNCTYCEGYNAGQVDGPRTDTPPMLQLAGIVVIISLVLVFYLGLTRPAMTKAEEKILRYKLLSIYEDLQARMVTQGQEHNVEERIKLAKLSKMKSS